MSEEKIRFVQHVYNEIMAGNYDFVRIPTNTWRGSGCITGSIFTIQYEYKLFSKRTVYLQRIVKGGEFWEWAYHRINITDEEAELLWSVWPRVTEDINAARQKEVEERLKHKEALEWWP